MSDVGGGLFVGLWFGFVGLLVLVSLAAIGLCIWVLVDVTRRPDWQFDHSGQSKVLWIVLAAVGLSACQLLGVVASAIYLLSVRKKLDAVVPPPYVPGPPGPWPPAMPGGWPPPGPGAPPPA